MTSYSVNHRGGRDVSGKSGIGDDERQLETVRLVIW